MARAFGYELECVSGNEAHGKCNEVRWWYATATSFKNTEALQKRDCNNILQAAKIRQRFHSQAANKEIAELAVLCRVLDDKVDLVMSNQDQLAYYGMECENCGLSIWKAVYALKVLESNQLEHFQAAIAELEKSGAAIAGTIPTQLKLLNQTTGYLRQCIVNVLARKDPMLHQSGDALLSVLQREDCDSETRIWIVDAILCHWTEATFKASMAGIDRRQHWPFVERPLLHLKARKAG